MPQHNLDHPHFTCSSFCGSLTNAHDAPPSILLLGGTSAHPLLATQAATTQWCRWVALAVRPSANPCCTPSGEASDTKHSTMADVPLVAISRRMFQGHVICISHLPYGRFITLQKWRPLESEVAEHFKPQKWTKFLTHSSCCGHLLEKQCQGGLEAATCASTRLHTSNHLCKYRHAKKQQCQGTFSGNLCPHEFVTALNLKPRVLIQMSAAAAVLVPLHISLRPALPNKQWAP